MIRSGLKECLYRHCKNTNSLGKTPSHLRLWSSSETVRFDITPGGQQVHVGFGENDLKSRRHPCFKLESPEALLKLRRQIWEHFEKADKASPQEADKPGHEDSGTSCSLLLLVHNCCLQNVAYPYTSKNRGKRGRISTTFFRQRLRWKQTRIQPLTCLRL